MLPKLSTRAHQRCEANILRAYPAWKQAELRYEGGIAFDEMVQFIELCKAHLSQLKGQIAEGAAVCIDTGWPQLGEKPEPVVEPEVIIKEVPVEKIVTETVQVENPETVAKLEEMEALFGETKAELDGLKARSEAAVSEAPDDQPPASIADLFVSDRPYAEQAQALWDRYNELTNKIMMSLASDAERAKHGRLQGELDWIKRHVFEGV